ncbi:hypothetical protein DKT77_04355 [Meridianimarinicoccus roseus]|uniref:HTH luxR-type domain-containing protein n=1 Tax=Meridianimarinicoccus roseus TaxID=2072018 RepID=A0A2V2LEE2_9RHOB|nr:LuxR C-terminal-related transcriptional regulator [Meridianimarinicoccus roseus]PWR03948.1 hypothetical protein DKT77_04355 [Meridianimarinicoccus roseus]
MPRVFEQVLRDVTDGLALAANPEERWAAIVAASQTVGATALSAGAVTLDTRETLWSRTTMPAEWVAEYDALGLEEIDPLAQGIRTGHLPELHAAGIPLSGVPPDSRFTMLRTRLLDHGYGWFWGHLWRQATHENVVVMATLEDPRSMFGPNTSILIRTVSALMAARLSAPMEADPVGDADSVSRSLSEREKDVMQLLARGKDNIGIAHSLGIAEVTVRMHLRSVRKKMGASTREQALALALLRGAFEP